MCKIWPIFSNDISEGRFRDGTPNWHFFETTSRGFPNVCTGDVLDPVENLRFLSKTVFAWDSVLGAEDYDTVAVNVGALVSSEGDYSTATFDCARNNSPGTITWDDADPAAGAVVGYVVRASSFSCDFGSYDAPTPNEQQGPRDAGIAVAPATCP